MTFNPLFFLQPRDDDDVAVQDDTLSFFFRLDKQQSFTLHCPVKYPDYDDEDNFFVETESGIQLWCNALNEYLLDSDRKLTLSAILNKGLSLYSSADQAVSRIASVNLKKYICVLLLSLLLSYELI